MKMYRETLRRLMPVGLPLAVATMIYTLIVGGQDCFGAYTRNNATTAVGMTPVLVYYVFCAALFALYGFSYLFKRSASDLFHSFPVTRMQQYLSNLLATATWMGGTILLNVLSILAMQLIGGIPFVPVYVPLTILFFFVASMLVYAATAIGCALSGTYLTALASTGVVLFLPRFLQFLLARSVVAQVPIIGWLDLNVLLNPMTNVATSLAVIQSRNVYIPFVVNLSYILYSLVPMALELTLGAWLYQRRPSETADRGSSHPIWTVVVACSLAVAALMLITVDNKRLFSMYGGAMTAVALLVFIIYLLVASRNVRRVLLALPCFLIAAGLAYGLSVGSGALVSDQLNVTPASEEIASVRFRGHDQKTGSPEYVTLLLPDVSYASDAVKKYVSDALSNAVEQIRDPSSAVYDVYSQYQVIEPITLTLTNGQTVNRTIEFKNVDALNDLRAEDPAFQAAIRSFPASDSIQYLSINREFSKAETRAIWDSYQSEAQTLGLVANDYYRPHTLATDSRGYSINLGGNQVIGSLYYTGFQAGQRFSEGLSIRLELPQTCALLMRTYNAHSSQDSISRLSESVQHMASPLALENDSLSLDLNFFNLPREDGDTVQTSVNLYLSGYNRLNSPYGEIYADLAKRFTEIFQRGTLTDDPTEMFLCLSWYEYDSGNQTNNPEPDAYYRFSAEDQQALLSLIDEWQSATLSGY